MGLGDFAKGLGDAVGNVAKVGAYALNPMNIDNIVGGAGKAVQFAAKNPGVIADVGEAIIKEELKPKNLLINAALIGATVATGGTAAPAAIAAKAATGARAVKTTSTVLRGAKAVETAVEAGKVARTTHRAVEIGRAAEKGLEGVQEVGKIAKTMDRINDVRRAASPIQEGLHGLRTGWGEKILEGGTGPVRQAVANVVQGTGRIGKTTRMAGQSERAYQAQQLARRGKNVRTVANVAQNAPEAVSAAADPTGYAMKKALGSGSGGAPTGETYETLPGGQAVPRRAGMGQRATGRIRTDLATGNDPNATLPSLSQPPSQPPPGNPPSSGLASPGPSGPRRVIPSSQTPAVSSGIAISPNGVSTPPGRQGAFSQGVQTPTGMVTGGQYFKTVDESGNPTYQRRMHAWEGPNREGLGGIDVDYDWRRFQKRASQPWDFSGLKRRARGGGGEEGEEGEGDDEGVDMMPPPSAPAAPSGGTASIMYRPQAETAPGARFIQGGRNQSFSSGQTTEKTDNTMGGTYAWNDKGQGSFAFPELTEPGTKQPETVTSVGTIKPVNQVNPARISKPGDETPPGVIGSSPSMSPWRTASQEEVDEGIKPSEGFWVRPSQGEDSAGSVMTNKPMRKKVA